MGYRTMYPKILESHNQTHQNLKLYKCDVCDKRFNQISQLKNHAVIHIDKSISEVPSWAKPKQCDICQKMFSDSKSLKKACAGYSFEVKTLYLSSVRSSISSQSHVAVAC